MDECRRSLCSRADNDVVVTEPRAEANAPGTNSGMGGGRTRIREEDEDEDDDDAVEVVDGR